jgi:ribosomal protein S18 acetylase RimI-like enzyme
MRLVNEGQGMTLTSDVFRLSDNRKVIVREPNPDADLEALVQFLSGLPADVRNYLRYDVTDVDPCRRRLKQVDEVDHWRVIAELDGRIVGDVTMDREPYGWSRHVAELRGVVHPDYRCLGIEPILFNQLVKMGSQAGIERLFTVVRADQREMIELLEKEGFVYEFTRRKYAKDIKGKLRDVVVMSNDLDAVWKQLADKLEEMDIRISRFY